MKGSVCAWFSIGSQCAKKLNYDVSYVNAVISAYNYYAEKEGFNLEKIEDDPAKVDEAVDKITKFLNDYSRNDSDIRRAINKNEKTFIGNTEIFAYKKLKRLFSPRELKGIKDEFIRSFINILDNTREEWGLQGKSYKEIFEEILDQYKQYNKGISEFILENVVDADGESSFNTVTAANDSSQKASFGSLKNSLVSLYKELKEQGEDTSEIEKNLEFVKSIIENADYIFLYALPDINYILGTKLKSSIFDNDNGAFRENSSTNSTESSFSEEEITIDGASELENNYDREESPLEHWMQILDHGDFVGSLAEIVKKIIFVTPMMKVTTEMVVNEDGTASQQEVKKIMETSILDLPRLSDPSREARRLMRLLHTSLNVEDMMTKLKEKPQYEALYNALEKDVRLKTTFFQNFNKCYQDYISIDTFVGSDGVVTSKRPTINKPLRKATVHSYFRGLKRLGDNSPSFFKTDKNNEVTSNFAKFSSFKKYFSKYVTTNGINDFLELDPDDQLSSFIYAFNSLGLTVDTAQVLEILSDETAITNILKGIGKIIGGDAETLYNPSRTDHLIPAIKNSETQMEGYSTLIKEVDAKNEFSNSFSSMVDYHGSTLSVFILASEFGNFVKDIKYRAGEALANFLETKFFNSPQFAEKDEKGNYKIRSRWLADFYNCRDIAKGSIRTKFSISRNLGIGDVNFEDTSDRMHLLSMILSYAKGRHQSRKSIAYIDRMPKNYDDLVEILEENGATDELGNKITISDSRGTRNKGIDITTYYYVKGSPQGVRVTSMKTDRKKGNTQTINRSDCAQLPTFITGDTNALRLINVLHYNKEEVIAGMIDMYHADKANQRFGKNLSDAGYAMRGNEKESYTTNYEEYGILQFINREDILKKVKEAEKNSLGKVEALEKALYDIFDSYLAESFKEFYTNCERLGITTLLDGKTSKYFSDDDILGPETTEKKLKDFLFDYYLNYKFGQYNQAMINVVDPHFFDSVETYQKRNKVNFTNGTQLALDAKDPVTNDYVFDQTNLTYKVQYFFDIVTSAEDYNKDFFSALESIYKNDPEMMSILDNYRENSLTDGFSLRNFDSYRRFMLGLGNNIWTDAMEEAYHQIKLVTSQIGYNQNLSDVRIEIDEDGNTASALECVTSLMTVFQPIKPVGQYIENFNGTNKVSVQLKYAEFPIIPELYPAGSPMRKLGYYMEGRNSKGELISEPIDLLASSRCVKDGCFGEMDLQYKTSLNTVELDGQTVNISQYVDENGDVIPGYNYDGHGNLDLEHPIENPTMYQQRRNPNFSKLAVAEDRDINEVLHEQSSLNAKAVTHELPLSGWLHQTNKPDHVHNEVNVGSQQQKIISGAISDTSDYNGIDIDGTKVNISGKDLRNLYNKLVSSRYARGVVRFLNLISSKNKTKLIETLSYQIATNSRNNKGNLEKLVLQNGTTVCPLYDKSLSHDVIPNILSIFRKGVIRRKMFGTNLIQASAMADSIERISDPDLGYRVQKYIDASGIERENIVSVDCSVPAGIFKTKDINGNEIPIDISQYTDSEGYFLLADGSGSAKGENKYASTKIEQDFPGILDILAHRVPTEMEYSMFRLRVVKVNVKVGDNTIKLSTPTTTTADFDFDIDSLFVQMKEFMQKKHSFKNQEIWDAFYNTSIGKKIQARLLEIKMSRLNESIDLEDLFNNEIQEEFGISKNDAFNIGIKAKFGTIYEKYDPTKSPFEQSEAACNNATLAIALAVLAHPDTVIDRTKPGGFGNMKLAASSHRNLRNSEVVKDLEVVTTRTGIKLLKFREKLTPSFLKKNPSKPNYDYSEPFTAIEFKQANQIADTLIGLFANQDMCHIISSHLAKIISGKSILIGDFVQSAEDNNGKGHQVFEINGVTKESNPDLFNELLKSLGTNLNITSINGRKIKKSLAEFLGSSVDAPKENALKACGINIYTADIAVILAKLGHTIDEVADFLNQPIIIDACQEMARSGETNIVNAIVKVFREKNFEIPDIKTFKSSNIDYSFLSREAMAYSIAYKDTLSEEKTQDPKYSNYYILSQKEVAKVFLLLNDVKNSYSSYVQISRNTSANSVASTPGDYEVKKYKDDKYLNNDDKIVNLSVDEEGKVFPIQAVDTSEYDGTMKSLEKLYESLSSDNPLAFENFVFNITRMCLDRFFKQETPYETSLFKRVREQVSQIWGSYLSLNAEVFNDINEALPIMIAKNCYGDLNPFSDCKDATLVKFIEGLINKGVIKKNNESFLNYKVYASADIIGELFNALYQAQNGTQTSESTENEDFENSDLEIPHFTQRDYEVWTESRIDSFLKEIANPNDETMSMLALSFDYNNDSLESAKYALDYLYTHGSPLLKSLAKAIFLHLYYNNGYSATRNFNPGAIPESILNDTIVMYGVNDIGNISFYEFERMLIDTDTSEDSIYGMKLNHKQLAFEFLLSNADNPKLVPAISPIKGKITISGDVLNIDESCFYKVKTANQPEKGVSVRPLISCRGQLYILDGFDSSYNNVVTGKVKNITYRRYNPSDVHEISEENKKLITRQNKSVFNQAPSIPERVLSEGDSGSIEDSGSSNEDENPSILEMFNKITPDLTTLDEEGRVTEVCVLQ